MATANVIGLCIHNTLTILHLFDILTSFFNLNHLSLSQGYLFMTIFPFFLKTFPILRTFLTAGHSASIFFTLPHDINTLQVQIGQAQSVAYPGFPREGGTNPIGSGPTYYLAKISQK